MLKLLPMTQDDQGLFLGLTDMVGWGLTEADYLRMMTLSPGGVFKATLGGEDVGVVVTMDYGELAWIGNLVVIPERRGRGIGEALMRHAVAHLEGRGVRAVRLDAVQRAIPLYRRLGFRDEYWSLRFAGLAAGNLDSSAQPMESRDLDAVAALDRRFFRGDRGLVLRFVYDAFPDLCYTAWSGEELVGYIMAKDGGDRLRVGPWVCAPGHLGEAEGLLRSVMSRRHGERVWVGVPEGNESSVAVLTRYGFTRLPSSLRMCYGDCGVRERVEGIYGLGGPDKG